MESKKLDDLLRVIELCRSVERSSVNPFEVDIREKIEILRRHLPEWKFLDELLLDSEAMLELAQIIKLQDQWLKHRASSLYIDPLLIQLKVKLLSKEELLEAFIRSWHPSVQLDQLTPKGLERAFIYWLELTPLSERFKEEFGNFGTRPGLVDYEDLVELKIFTQEQFESKLREIHSELLEASKDDWVDYRKFIDDEAFEKKIVRAYMLAFLVSEGRATLKTDPLAGTIWVRALKSKTPGEPRSVAISITGER